MDALDASAKPVDGLTTTAATTIRPMTAAAVDHRIVLPAAVIAHRQTAWTTSRKLRGQKGYGGSSLSPNISPPGPVSPTWPRRTAGYEGYLSSPGYLLSGRARRDLFAEGRCSPPGLDPRRSPAQPGRPGRSRREDMGGSAAVGRQRIRGSVGRRCRFAMEASPCGRLAVVWAIARVAMLGYYETPAAREERR